MVRIRLSGQCNSLDNTDLHGVQSTEEILNRLRNWLGLTVHKTIMILLLLLTAASWLSGRYAFAQSDPCKPNLIDVDVCERVSQLQKALAQQLPQKMSNDLVWEKVAAFGPELMVYVRLTYDRSYLQSQATSAGVPMEGLDQKMREMTVMNVCSQDVTRALIELGGAINYFYMFEDGESYLSIPIEACDQ